MRDRDLLMLDKTKYQTEYRAKESPLVFTACSPTLRLRGGSLSETFSRGVSTRVRRFVQLEKTFPSVQLPLQVLWDR